MSDRVLTLRRADACSVCGSPLAVAARARWNADARTVTCLSCTGAREPVEHGPAAPLQDREDASAAADAAGGSAQREYERRREAREQRVRARHPRIGGLLLALVDEPSTTKVWAQGAEGERAVGHRLDRVEHGLVLHDRSLRRVDGSLSRANIDHLVVVPSGVWVVDAKTHRGRLEVRRSGGLLSPRVEQLRIGGRDQTKLIDGVRRQTQAVRAAVAGLVADAEVRGALCFVGTDLPWLDEDIDGIPLRGLRGTAELLRRPGPLDTDHRAELHQRLAAVFPAA